MHNFYNFLLLLSFVGGFFGCLVFLHRWFPQQKGMGWNWPLACFLSLGIRGIIASWFFYIGWEIQNTLLVAGSLGALGLGAFLYEIKARGYSWMFARSIDLGSPAPKWSKLDYLLLLSCVYLMSMHLYRAGAPWYHGDEFNVYGLLAQVISDGFVYSDIFPIWRRSQHLGPKMVEALDGQWLFLLGGDTLFAKLIRIANLGFLALFVSQFTAWLTKRRAFGLLAAGMVLQTPELRFLGAALKVDSVVMCFELISIIYLAMALIGSTKEFQEDFLVRSKQVWLSLALALFALASRQSGMYIASLATLFAFYFLWKSERRTSQKALCCLGIFAAWGLFSVTPIFHIIYQGNPLYPFPGPWPFQNGTYIRTVDYFRGISNLQGLPPVITQLYLIFHLALGLEWRLQFPNIPHALHRGTSMEWLHPAMILIYAAPFFWKKSKPILFFSIIFIYLYTIWSTGVHFSRVFLAAGSIPIFIGILIWQLDPTNLSKIQRIVRKGTIVVMAFSFLMLHRNAYNYNVVYPHSVSALWSKSARYQAVQNLFLVGGNVQGTGFPSKASIEKMDAILAQYGKPKVYVYVAFGRQIRILFDKGFFTEQNKNWDVINCALIQEIPNYFYGEDKPAVERAFPVVKFAPTPEEPFTLRCKDDNSPGGLNNLHAAKAK